VSESRFFGGGQPVHQKRIRCLDEALAGFKSRYPFGSNVLSEEQVWRIENGHWSADEQISLALILDDCYIQQDHIRYNVSGADQSYFHGLRDYGRNVRSDIIHHGFRSSQATGIMGQREGVYAFSLDRMHWADYRDEHVLGRIVQTILVDGDPFPGYVLFRTRHPCVIGQHINAFTAHFPLPEGKYVNVQDPLFIVLQNGMIDVVETP